MEQYFAGIPARPDFEIQTVLNYEREKLTHQRICEKVRFCIGNAYETILENRRDIYVRTSGSFIRTAH